MLPKDKAISIFSEHKTVCLEKCKAVILKYSSMQIKEQINLLKEMDDRWHSCLENPMTTIFETEIEFLQLVKKELELL